jgi:hypothetical protein
MLVDLNVLSSRKAKLPAIVKVVEDAFQAADTSIGTQWV